MECVLSTNYPVQRLEEGSSLNMYIRKNHGL